MDQIKISSLVIGLILCLVTPALVFSQEKTSNEKSEETLNIQVEIFKKPGCKCCEKWAEHLEKHGFNITLTATDTLNEIKDQQDIPKNLRSCHTAFINDYVVEGHVPAESIKKMLKERPKAVGITVPNMPSGTPGMGQDGTPFEVLLFDEEGNHSVYESY